MSPDGGADPEVAVVGSLNIDLTVPVVRTPRPGETVIGGAARRAFGGKGANQAVACARLGLRTAMVGAVGADTGGRDLLDRLRAEDVETGHVGVVDAETGLAVVIVDDDGESTIVVSPGANGTLKPGHVDAARDLLARSAALLCQLEVPTATVTRACELAAGLVVLNPAPGQELPAELLARVDVLVPNRLELALLAGQAPASSHAEVERQARSLAGPAAVVVTLGADGALLVTAEGSEHVPARAVATRDTTAAGDSFCAGLVHGLLRDRPLPTAVRDAAALAALTTTRPGAMDALPHRDDAQVRGVLG